MERICLQGHVLDRDLCVRCGSPEAQPTILPEDVVENEKIEKVVKVKEMDSRIVRRKVKPVVKERFKKK